MAPVIVAMLPIIAVIAAIGLAAGLLYAAWTNNWGGIQEKTAVVWNVIQQVGAWIQTNLFPIFSSLGELLASAVGAELSSLSLIWQNVFLPIITAVWDFIKVNIIPLFEAIGKLIGVLMVKYVNDLSAKFNLFLAAMKPVGDFIKNTISPALSSVGSEIQENLMPIIEALADFFSGALKSAFDDIANVIQFIIGLINDLIAALGGVQLPSGLDGQGAQATLSFSTNLSEINAQLMEMATQSIPAVQYQMTVSNPALDVQSMTSRATAPVSSVTNSSQNTSNYLFGARFSVENQSSLTAILRGTAA